MAGELKLNNVSVATESGGTVTVGNSNVALSTGLSNLDGMFLLSSGEATNVASVDFNNSVIVSSYSYYVLRVHKIIPTTDNAGGFLSFSSDNGASFLSCETGKLYSKYTGSASSGHEHHSGTAGVQLGYQDLSNTSGLGLVLEYKIFSTQDTSRSISIVNGITSGQNHDDVFYTWWTSGLVNKASGNASINFIRIKFDTGTIATISYRLYGAI